MGSTEHKTPCGWFRGLVALLAFAVTILAAILGVIYHTAAQAADSAGVARGEVAVTRSELAVELKYIRASLDDIRADLRQKGRP